MTLQDKIYADCYKAHLLTKRLIHVPGGSEGHTGQFTTIEGGFDVDEAVKAARYVAANSPSNGGGVLRDDPKY